MRKVLCWVSADQYIEFEALFSIKTVPVYTPKTDFKISMLRIPKEMNAGIRFL